MPSPFVPSARLRQRAVRLACAFAPVLAAPAAHADAACDVVTAAMTKMAATPNHQFIATTRNGRSTQGEVVTLGAKRWVFAANRWQSRPYDAASEARDLAEAARAAKQSCTRVRSEAVDGEAATVFSVHTASEDGNSDSQVWVSTSRGLPLRQVIDIPEGKQHLEVRIDYAHVAPPAAG